MRAPLLAVAVLLWPALVHAEADVVLGVPLDGNATAASAATEAVQEALAETGRELASPQALNERLGRIGGIELCDEPCRRRLAGDLAPTRLVTVSTTTGGGWTTISVAHQRPDGHEVLATALFPEGGLDDVRPSLAARLRAATGELRIRGEFHDVEVYVDGVSLGSLPVGDPVELTAGLHLVRLNDGRGAGHMIAVTVRPGVSEELDLAENLRGVEGLVVHKPLWRRPWVWALAAGVVGASAFAGTRGFGLFEPGETTVIVRPP